MNDILNFPRCVRSFLEKILKQMGTTLQKMTILNDKWFTTSDGTTKKHVYRIFFRDPCALLFRNHSEKSIGLIFTENGDFEEGTCVHIVATNEFKWYINGNNYFYCTNSIQHLHGFQNVFFICWGGNMIVISLMLGRLILSRRVQRLRLTFWMEAVKASRASRANTF